MKKHHQPHPKGGDELPFDPRPSDARPVTRQDVEERKQRRQSLLQDLKDATSAFPYLKPLNIFRRALWDKDIRREVERGEWD